MKIVSAVLVFLLLVVGLVSGCKATQPAALPVVNYFYGNPASIAKGGSSNLIWSVTGASSMAIEPGLGTVPLVGSRAVSPDSSTTYKLTAMGNGGSTSSDTTVTVSAAPAPSASIPVISYFEASPDSTLRGGIPTLVWSVTGASTVSIDNGVGSVPAQGRKGVIPISTTTYTLTATNDAGQAQASTTVTVTEIVPAQPPAVVLSFTSSMEADVTQPFTISVDEDPARSFEWQLDYFDPEYVSLVSNTLVGYNLTPGGPPGMRNFTFEALKVGDTRIKLSDVSVTDPLNATFNFYDVHIIPYPNP